MGLKANYKLAKEQKDFLLKLVPFSRFIQDQTKEKTDFFNIYSPLGLKASIFLGYSIIQTNWGAHEITLYNNLLLLEKDERWKGKVIELEDKVYKKFSNWHEFCSYYTDLLIFQCEFREAFAQDTFEGQLKAFIPASKLPSDYYEKIYQLVLDYNLDEFDLY